MNHNYVQYYWPTAYKSKIRNYHRQRQKEYQNVGVIKIYIDLIKITFEIKISKKVINNSDWN